MLAGKVAVVTAQNGPAATLLVAGLAEALTASIPVVALVQAVAAVNRDRNAFQELDQLELFIRDDDRLGRVADPDRHLGTFGQIVAIFQDDGTLGGHIKPPGSLEKNIGIRFAVEAKSRRNDAVDPGIKQLFDARSG